LAQDQASYVLVGLRELHLLEPGQCPPRRQRTEGLDAGARDDNRACLRPPARAPALRAGAQRHELLYLRARPLRVGLAIAALKICDPPLEAGPVGAGATETVAVGDLQ